MLNRPPRVLAVHDLSGFGRCSLTVALPVLSACGITCACLPTAILSTHTGGFTGYTFRDLTDDLQPMADHLSREKIRFEALYTGYLGSEKQLSIVENILTEFGRPGVLTLVDPVLGDEGRLYAGLTPRMVAGMRRLCARADVIVPNMTEAALLLGRPYADGRLDEEKIRALCEGLLSLGAKAVALTGVMPDDGHIGAACFDGKELTLCVTERIPARFDGTGDVFSSVLVGALMNGKPLPAAAKTAAGFTKDCIALTAARGGNPHYGVDFEEFLWSLRQRMEEEA